MVLPGDLIELDRETVAIARVDPCNSSVFRGTNIFPRNEEPF